MAHEIDESTGRAAVFVAGEPAWHRLGRVVSQAQTSAEAIALAGLDWEVIQQLVFTRPGGSDGNRIDPGLWATVPGVVANVRSDTGAVLGVVGKGYRPFQNRQAFDFMDALVGERLAMFETAGGLNGGRRVWMMARIPTELRAGGGDDVVNPYVLLSNSHDGTGALRMIPTSVRVVCQNTLHLALGRAGTAGLSIRHTESLDGRVRDARENLGIITRRVSAFQAELDALAAVSMKGSEVGDYFRSVMKVSPPRPPLAAGQAAAGAAVLETILEGQSAHAAVMGELLAGHREQSARKEENDRRLLERLLDNYYGDPAAGTAWGALNAVTEYVDHQQRSRSADTRLNSVWFGAGEAVKQEAFRQALALAV